MLEEKLNLKWRVILHTIGSASWQMALDHALLDVMNDRIKAGKEVVPVVRTYQFSKDAIVLGYKQKSERFDKKNLNGCDLTRRITGGGHMYISPYEIHFSAVIPADLDIPKKFYFKDDDKKLIARYRMINYPLVYVLNNLGFNVKLGRMSIKADLDKEKTLFGSSQRRIDDALLHHGTIMVKDYTDNIFEMFGSSDDEKIVWKENITTLANLKGDISLDKLPLYISKSFIDAGFLDSKFSIEEKEKAKMLYKSMYTNESFINTGVIGGMHICLIEGLMIDEKHYKKHLEENTVEN